MSKHARLPARPEMPSETEDSGVTEMHWRGPAPFSSLPRPETSEEIRSLGRYKVKMQSPEIGGLAGPYWGNVLGSKGKSCLSWSARCLPRLELVSARRVGDTYQIRCVCTKLVSQATGMQLTPALPPVDKLTCKENQCSLIAIFMFRAGRFVHFDISWDETSQQPFLWSLLSHCWW